MRRGTTIETRSTILKTAAQLFYREGIHAVGVDTIVERSGVAKMTLYRHFESKDELVAAWLSQSDAFMWDSWNAVIDRVPTYDHLRRIEALFSGVETMAQGAECRGCAFQMTAGEFPDPSHPGHVEVQKHKRKVFDWLHQECRALGLSLAQECAWALYWIIEGVWTSVRVFGPKVPSRPLSETARVLIEGYRTIDQRTSST